MKGNVEGCGSKIAKELIDGEIPLLEVGVLELLLDWLALGFHQILGEEFEQTVPFFLKKFGEGDQQVRFEGVKVLSLRAFEHDLGPNAAHRRDEGEFGRFPSVREENIENAVDGGGELFEEAVHSEDDAHVGLPEYVIVVEQGCRGLGRFDKHEDISAEETSEVDGMQDLSGELQKLGDWALNRRGVADIIVHDEPAQLHEELGVAHVLNTVHADAVLT